MLTKIIAIGLAAVLGVSVHAAAALANGYGEDVPWQFQTTTDMANLAAVESLIQQKRAGGFGPAETNTINNSTQNVGTENNCDVTAATTGNAGTNTESANSPINSGSTAGSTGNSNTSSTSQGGASQGVNKTGSSQSNSGQVSAGNSGNNSSSNSGSATQGLTSTQGNTSSTLSATANGDTACRFTGPLNTGGHISH